MKLLGQAKAHENEKEILRTEISTTIAAFEDNDVTSTTVKQAVYLLLRVCRHLLTEKLKAGV